MTVAVGAATDDVGSRPPGHGTASFQGLSQHMLGAFDAETRPLARR